MTWAGMLKLASVDTRRSEIRATASGDSPLPWASLRRTAASGSVHWRRSASANASATSASPSSPFSAAAAAAAARESCTPSSAATVGSGGASSGSGVAAPKISGASEMPSMRCGSAAGTGREKSRSGFAGWTEVRMRSPASMVRDS